MPRQLMLREQAAATFRPSAKELSTGMRAQHWSQVQGYAHPQATLHVAQLVVHERGLASNRPTTTTESPFRRTLPGDKSTTPVPTQRSRFPPTHDLRKSRRPELRTKSNC